jgi:hypothetical protein
VKEWRLTYRKGGENLSTSVVSDVSKWHQHVKRKERGLGFDVIKDERNVLTPFPSAPLHQGVPLEGWVCFKASAVKGKGADDGRIELLVVDSFGQEYRVESPAPSACKGDMVNPDVPR